MSNLSHLLQLLSLSLRVYSDFGIPVLANSVLMPTDYPCSVMSDTKFGNSLMLQSVLNQNPQYKQKSRTTYVNNNRLL